jgi:RNA polymerase sigma factor for flagellar operon FliA
VTLAARLQVESPVRDDLVMRHVSLVRILAAKLRRRLPSQVEFEELVSAGVLGLIAAANRYQPSLGVPFDAFARRRIHGAMLDSLRSLDNVSRAVRKRQRDVENAIAKLRQQLGREPDTEEITRALGIGLDEYSALLASLKSCEIATARHVSEDRVARLIDFAVDPDEGPHRRFERSELRQHLARALNQLPTRERQVLALSYVEDMTLAEIGAMMGVSESRICQVRNQAVVRLRSLMRPPARERTSEAR